MAHKFKDALTEFQLLLKNKLIMSAKLVLEEAIYFLDIIVLFFEKLSRLSEVAVVLERVNCLTKLLEFTK